MRDSKQEVLRFWFEETKPQQWFQENDAFDLEIEERFLVTYDMARRDLCAGWSADPYGVLALCLVLDQFPRNMFRGKAKAFETDEKIRAIVRESLRHEFDCDLSIIERQFLYLPLMHSENIDDQKECVKLYEKIKDQNPLGYEYALKHLDVIERFGRFPHRNAALCRVSTAAEREYLAQPNAGF